MLGYSRKPSVPQRTGMKASTPGKDGVAIWKDRTNGTAPSTSAPSAVMAGELESMRCRMALVCICITTSSHCGRGSPSPG